MAAGQARSAEVALRKLSWVLTIPITLVVVVFTLANRQPVAIDLWPFDLVAEPPLYLLVLLTLLLGFLLGIVVLWLAGGRARDRARRAHYRASDLEREVAWLRRKQAEGQIPRSGNGQTPAGSQLPSRVEPPGVPAP